MIAHASTPKHAGRSNGRLQPLENGDCLGAPEFLRRYEAMPQIKKAERIEGLVYMGSPVSYAQRRYRKIKPRKNQGLKIWISCLVSRDKLPHLRTRSAD